MITNTTAMVLQVVCVALMVSTEISVLACSLNTSGNISERLTIEEMPPVLEPQNASAILKKLLSNYDKRLRPGHAERPLDIAINIGVLSISNIEEENMKFTVDMFLRQLWFDSRLAFGNGSNALVLQQEVLDKLWLPDTYFENSVKTTVQKETMTVILTGDGLLAYSKRVKVIARTSMNFHAFPMDKQTFRLDVASYGFETSQLRYRRIHVHMLNEAYEMSDFVIINQSTTIGTTKYFLGCFEILKIAFTAKRRSGYYFIKVYFPAILCTVVSWLAFWIDPRSIGDRGTVGITSLLTQMFLVQSVNENMPRVSYVKAADLFLIVSFAFSFTTLLESVIVYKAASREKREVKTSPIATQGHETDQQTCVANQSEETAVNVLERKNRISMILHLTEPKGISEVQETNRLMETWIDIISRVLFPSAYAAFLVGYFTTYMA